MSNINFKGNGPIDFEGIRKFLETMEDDCRICDHAKRKLEGKLCNNCCMRSNSSYDEKRRRVYPGAIFKQFGLINLPAMGKHMFFYFLDHEELDFTYPVIPDKDLIENVNRDVYPNAKNKKYFLWHIHHENEEYWNDSKYNLMLCLNTEHPNFGAKNKH